MGDGILRQDSDAVGRNQLRNAVIDLRIDVVRSSGKHNAVSACLLQIGERLLTLLIHGIADMLHLFPACQRGGSDLVLWNLREYLDQLRRHGLKACQGKKRVAEINVRKAQFFHVVLDILRIGGDDRTVVVVLRVRKFVSLIRHTRIKDKGTPWWMSQET